MNIKLKIWRQKNKDSKGHFEEYAMSGIEEHMSFLEVLDLLNEQLFAEGKEPVAFDSDCREGICGQCGVVINGQAHGPIRSTTGGAPEAHSVPVQKEKADAAFEAAACIGCGACVAACPNASAMLFTGAKISHLGLLPQGQPERLARAVSMLNQHDAEGFGGCTNIGECAAVCPKSVPLEVISRLNRDLGHALWKGQHAH